MENSPTNLGKKLTLRYIIALSLIALSLFVSHILFTRQINLSNEDAYLINISGMQRMLSQRTALMTREIFHADSQQQADSYYEKLINVTQTMKENHTALTTGLLPSGKQYKLSPALSEIYFGQNGIDKQIGEYIRLCDLFAQKYKSGGLAAIRETNLHKEIVAIARNGFLDRLNDIVSLYENEAKAKVDSNVNLALIVFLFGLCLLFIEALFIFRPMVKNVIRTVTALERTNAELTEFSYRISHDLRAPIISSLGLIKVSKQGLLDKKEKLAIGAMDHIETSMTRLDTLINDIINLTKMKLSDVPRERTNLQDLLDKTLEDIHFLENYALVDIQIENKITSDFLVKSLFLQQTLQNLISNAVKYCDPEKQQPFINIKAKLVHEVCHIEISDNGIGIPEEYREQIFGLFKRFHPKHSFGSGLGLYLVLQNVKSLNGQISYIPLEHGTKFSLKFPVKTIT